MERFPWSTILCRLGLLISSRFFSNILHNSIVLYIHFSKGLWRTTNFRPLFSSSVILIDFKYLEIQSSNHIVQNRDSQISMRSVQVLACLFCRRNIFYSVFYSAHTASLHPKWLSWLQKDSLAVFFVCLFFTVVNIKPHITWFCNRVDYVLASFFLKNQLDFSMIGHFMMQNLL